MKRMIRCLAAVCTLALGITALAGCGAGLYVVSVEQSGTNGTESEFTVTYSDGTTSTFSVRNGTDGQDGQDVTVDDIYRTYCETYGEISYDDFLKEYLSLNAQTDPVTVSSVAKALNSSLKVYTEFVETSVGISFGRPVYTTNTALYTGSAVIWEVGEEYTYLVTNYHVIYDSSADSSKNGGYTARKIMCYLYGSENTPVENGKDSDGYTAYDYGSYAVSCDYIGGSVEYDIAVLRTQTSSLSAINESIMPVTPADAYYVGQTAIAIGNPEGEGISVTKGIVSVDNEYIQLSLDGTTRYYRSMRIDTAIYGGNSGGGLFNLSGELIGITNAGDGDDQNINYAIPLTIVKGAVENILYFAQDGAVNGVNKVTLGLSVTSQNSRYEYDSATGYGTIKEQIVVSAVTAGSIAENMGVVEGDTVTAISVNGVSYSLNRSFDIADLILTMRPNDEISFTVQRGSEALNTDSYRLMSSEFNKIA